MQAIARLHRLSHACHRRGVKGLSRLLDGVSRVAFGCSVPGRARIGQDVFFHHSGLGVVINGASVIEDGCEIGVHVVLGGRAPVVGAPHIERDVIIHAGARIIGPVRIGQGSVVAANAVVLQDMPANSLIAGVPATVRRSGIDNSAYRHDAPPQILGQAELAAEG
ncbi:serine O-acetyltransferase [Bosea lathyri]|uniref:Serine acetyltransferase n=1 Tax=Bosea lathyri TaxID=1036778 RepID=A0A1H6BHH0_9HYPH|nr:serine acetyltransferase [Bosea lathyri]SEG60179.1 serine O-acetyltransferase [Bosea lathyri]